MKTYELMTVFKPNLDAEETDKLIDAIGKIVTDLKGKVKFTDKAGRKKLAYDIKGFRDGFFTTYIVELPETATAEFRRQLKLNDNILRTMFLESKDAVKA